MSDGFDVDRIYEVFARQKREDRLEHVGAISAPNASLARVYAWQTYDEATWFEMVVAPRDSFEAVNREEAPFALEPRAGSEPRGEGAAG